MKVLFVNSLYHPNEIGGAERSVRLIAEGLQQRGHQSVVASLAPDGIARTDTVSGVKCHYVPLANIYWPHGRETPPAVWKRIIWHSIDAYNPVMAHRLGDLLDREKPDVVHMHNLQGFSVSAWRAAKARGIPVVQTLRDYYLSCPNSVMFKNGRNCVTPCLECRVFGASRKLLSNIPDTVTGVSARTLGLLVARGLFGKVRKRLTIYNSVSSRGHADRADIPPGGPLRVGFFGRVEIVKGLDILLAAAATIPREKIEVIVGGQIAPSYQDELTAAYPGNKVQFLGFVKPEEYFNSIDILVVPSQWEEPFGRVVLDAYTHGIYVIVAKVGGLPEVVVPGETGEIFEPGDVFGLSEILRNIINDGFPTAEMHSKTREFCRKFSQENIIDQYESVLRDAVNSVPARV